jgi:hypothetical protein
MPARRGEAAFGRFAAPAGLGAAVMLRHVLVRNVLPACLNMLKAMGGRLVNHREMRIRLHRLADDCVSAVCPSD